MFCSRIGRNEQVSDGVGKGRVTTLLDQGLFLGDREGRELGSFLSWAWDDVWLDSKRKEC